MHPLSMSHTASGNHDVGDRPTKSSVGTYKERFGDDYAAFWCGGCKIYLLNSSLLQAKEPDLWKVGWSLRDSPEDAPELKRQQAEALAMYDARASTSFLAYARMLLAFVFSKWPFGATHFILC